MKKNLNNINSLEKDVLIWKDEIKNVKKLNSKYVYNEVKKKKDSSAKLVNNVINKTGRNITKENVKTIKIGDSAGINYKDMKKMDSGQYTIDSMIDLHGLTIDQAFTAFCSFIENSFLQGSRMLLVITGKGLQSDPGVLTINQALQEWVNYPELRSNILRYNYAIPKHGGKGAYYIFLKKNKEK